MTDIIPIVNRTFPTSFGDVDKAQQAIIDCGWGPLNYTLLEHCNVLKTKPVPPDTSSSVSSDQLESASSYAVTTNSNECSVTINIAKGAAGRAIDAIVQSEMKSVGTRKARKERKEKEEDEATSGEQLAKMAKVTSGALASRGHYCLDADLHQQVLESHMGKQAAAAAAEVNCGVREDSQKEKALAAWTKRRQCT